MAFLNQFASFFNAQERDTELYKMWSAIGVNMEKAIIEEQNSLNAEMTDINTFSEDTLRSWLGFFLNKIPYRTSAIAEVNVSLKDYTANGTVTIPQYSELLSDSGITYTQMEEIILNSSSSKLVKIVQGKRIVAQGTYDSIIKMQVNNIDLNYIKVYMGDQEIKEVSYYTTYDTLKYKTSWSPTNEDGKTFGGTPQLINGSGDKGECYNVIANGSAKFGDDNSTIYDFNIGDVVVYDGEKWTPISDAVNLNLIYQANDFGIPRNGYFAYYTDGYLYIKIFKGDEVGEPNGQNYTVEYIQSDGVQGEVTNEPMSYKNAFTDSPNGDTVEVIVSNATSSAGINSPSKGKLSLILKQQLFAQKGISSIPEYTNWFKAQPEIGNCLVLSDWERFLYNGDSNMTGYVDIYAVDHNGQPLTSAVQTELLNRIEPYKDIAYLRFRDFTHVEDYFEVTFNTAESIGLFESFVDTCIRNYFDIDFLQSTTTSLFEDLDLAMVLNYILNNSEIESTGLTITAYHTTVVEDINSSTSVVTMTPFKGESKTDGWYELCDENDNVLVKLYEAKLPNESDGSIYYNNRVVGVHTDTYITLTLDNIDGIENIAKIRAYWSMEDKGILTVGQADGMRTLKGISIKQV